MISSDLVYVRWAIVVGHTKRQFQILNLLEVKFKLDLKKKTFYKFQNVLMDPEILKEKQIFLFFSMLFGIFASFQKII